jgi:tetratricopeptide (TPR) repeat protein
MSMDPRRQATEREVATLASQAASAMQSGRTADAVLAWRRIVDLDPGNVPALNALGQHAFRSGDAALARDLFRRVAEADGRDPQQWLSLALACRALREEAGEEMAIAKALEIDPGDLLSLLLRGELLERRGKMHAAAAAYGAAATVAPPMDRLHPDLRAPVARARAFRQDHDRRCASFVDDFLAPRFRELGHEDLQRFRESVDIMLGRARRYDPQPSHYYFPRLAPIPFFDPAEFPWIDEVESATERVLSEFRAVLESDEGFSPYIAYPPGLPLNQWAELNHSPRWSAFRLIEKGEAVPGNAAKCPATLGMLARVGQPDQPGRTPNAMFSLLRPRTRIPPHTGVSNVRLVAHLPLIVPEGCGFRVAGETRQWVPGKAWVFDDTIEHEAWNDSDRLRVVLIFDVWHPHLTPAERGMISSLAQALQAFNGTGDDFDL